MSVRTAPLSSYVAVHNISVPVEIAFDEDATEIRVQFMKAYSEEYTITHDNNCTTIRQIAPRTYDAADRNATKVHRRARKNAVEQNVPIKDRIANLYVEGQRLHPSIIITVGPAIVGIHGCQEVVGTVGGDLHANTKSHDYLGISGARHVAVHAADVSTIELSDVKGDLDLDASGYATIITDSAPGEVEKYTEDQATITVG